MERVEQLIGVYHADGGVVGELRYLLGSLLGTAHCSLCDVTHSPIRRKPAWDAMVARLGVPFTLLHLNEMPTDVASAVAVSGSPAVLARTRNGLAVILTDRDIDALDGSVTAAEIAIRRAVGDIGASLD